MPADDDVTIPRQLFELREYQVHLQRHLIRLLASTIESMRKPNRTPEQFERAKAKVAEIMADHEAKMIAAMDMTAEEIRRLYS